MKKSYFHGESKKSIFRTLFVPLFIIMILQAITFYVVAVYGGIEETLNQNAADILTERLINRKNEMETLFTKSWTNLEDCEMQLKQVYDAYTDEYGDKPLASNTDIQIRFIEEASQPLIKTLRDNGVNGVFLLLNNQKEQNAFPRAGKDVVAGLCIRDMDQMNNYTSTEDLLIERSPSALIDQLGCSLDSWWEARYTFESTEEGNYYYEPLRAAWNNIDSESDDLAYFAGAHQISESDQEVVSYSIPLLDDAGYPYAVLGVELTTKYLNTLMPYQELNGADKSSYVLAIKDPVTAEYEVITATGSLFMRCFANETRLSMHQINKTGGFDVTGRDGTLLYGNGVEVEIYNTNNPFESEQLIMIALVEHEALFSYITSIKKTLALVSVLSLTMGLVGLLMVSRHFSKPITELAEKVMSMPPQDDFQLERLNIREIDQLVESIESLTRNASRDIARTEFFSRMSHDMRTPMNAIISFSSAEMLEGTPEAQKNEYLNKIHSSGEYLLGLINEVLDMTKIESNKVVLQPVPVRASELWNTVIPMIDKLAQKKRIQFIKEIDYQDTLVLADVQHLNQIMMNLLSNAVKFTPDGGDVRLNVEITDSMETQELAFCVTVSDTGIGMSESFMQNLYRPFEQENEGREGTGLGLSIAKKLIELMDGTITCTSEKDNGTTFCVRFALKIPSEQDGEIQKSSKSELESERIWSERIRSEQTQSSQLQSEHIAAVQGIPKHEGLQGKRILVCEDHNLNLQIITRLLQREGIEVAVAENGQKGVNMFEASGIGYYDAVLMDIRMPIMDGIEASKAIRALDRSDARTIPIIAMTANAFEEDVHTSREAGMNAHLSKPVEPQKLYHTLEEFMCFNTTE